MLMQIRMLVHENQITIKAINGQDMLIMMFK